MNLRQKLLLIFSLTVAAAVAAVAWTVLLRVRQVIEQRDQQETALFVSQFQREFQHRSGEVATTMDRMAGGERVRAMAFSIVQSGDASPYLNEAETLAQDAQLDFLEVVGPDAKIVSSAQWPARFGYIEPVAGSAQRSFLKTEDLPDGTTALGLFALRLVGHADASQSVYLIGGKRLDQSFLADLPVVPGMQVALYRDGDQSSSTERPSLNPDPAVFDPERLIGISGQVPNGPRYESLIRSAIHGGQQTSSILSLTDRREDSVSATAIPLKSEAGKVIAVLVVSLSRRGLVEAEQHIRAIAYGVAAAGILLTIVFSLWIAARVSRPIERLASAAEAVAAGDWETRVPEHGHDEVGVLAHSFNHMTGQLVSQRDRLIRTERVAAWRELARRLAHELKNPLFPLQLTVENLVRSRDLPEFDEVFRESTQTLGMEIANLKTIIGRFSDFSKMPKPQLERIEAKEVIERVRTLYQTAGNGMGTNAADGTPLKIHFEVETSAEAMPLLVDPELLHRALSNLVLNAMDAMPEGGTLTLSAKPIGDQAEIRVTDTGEGITPEECERLFTPYYTTKQHGTGLGLAIVQSVVADHRGAITVESRVDGGTSFKILLPLAGKADV